VPDAFPDHFALFGLAPRFALDRAALAAAHRRLLTQVHPDRHVLADAASRRAALQWASRANEAFEILSRPSSRAAYLCELRGHPVVLEGNQPLDASRLAWLMQWREDLDEARAARDAGALAALEASAQAERTAAEAAVAALLDGDSPAPADAAVHRLVFAEKLCEQSHEALIALEAHGAAADL